MQQELGIEVQWTAFPLHPETPEQGQTLEDLFAGRGMDIPAMLARLKMVADDLGLAFGERRMTYNSRRAQEMGKWAEAEGRGQAFHDTVFKAYFAHGLNIAQLDVLETMAASVGLDGREGLDVLQAGRYREAVDADWRRSRQIGITAVPSFGMGDRILTGAQSYAVLKSFVLGDSGLSSGA